MSTPASPPAGRVGPPSWRDPRLVFGVVLVLASVVLGARLLSGSDRTSPVWVVTADLASGTRLDDDHLERRRVRLFDAGDRYVAATGGKPTGLVLLRAVGRGELLPYAAVARADAAPETRLVTLPVDRLHLPLGLASGQAVDVYVTPGGRTGTVTGPPQLVLSHAVVDDRTESGAFGAADQVGVSVVVPASAVPQLVAAAQAGRIDLVRVPADAPDRSPSAAGAPTASSTP